MENREEVLNWKGKRGGGRRKEGTRKKVKVEGKIERKLLYMGEGAQWREWDKNKKNFKKGLEM